MRKHFCAFDYFNPRSREGSDGKLTVKQHSITISIRAPARGATFDKFADKLSPAISIRAPARGATFDKFADKLSPAISIRAPARGATIA